MNEESRPKAAPSSPSAGRPDSSKTTSPNLAPLGSASIDDLAVALGQAYPGGPFECPNAWCRSPRVPWERSRACFVQRPGLARCTACDTTFTVWRLRRHVLEDPVLARRLRTVLGVAELRDLGVTIEEAS